MLTWLKTQGLDLLKRLAAPAFTAAFEWLRDLIFGKRGSDAKRIEAQRKVEAADESAELRAKAEHERIARERKAREEATRALLSREPTESEVQDLIQGSKEEDP